MHIMVKQFLENFAFHGAPSVGKLSKSTNLGDVGSIHPTTSVDFVVRNHLHSDLHIADMSQLYGFAFSGSLHVSTGASKNRSNQIQ